MKINYKVSEVNMKLIEADTPNKAMWDELTKDPKTHRVCELTLSFFSVLFSWLSLLCEITYRHHLAMVSVRRKRYKAIIRIWPLNSLILLKNLGGHHLLLIISFHQKTLFYFNRNSYRASKIVSCVFVVKRLCHNQSLSNVDTVLARFVKLFCPLNI